jgi:hypothetical protein
MEGFAMKRVSTSVLLAVLALLVVSGAALAAQAIYTAVMLPNDIVPLPVNVNSKASGFAKFALSDDGQSMTFGLSVKKIDKVTQAHIHQYVGDGRNGPIIVWLYPDVTSTAPGAPSGKLKGVLSTGTFGPEHLRNGFTWEQALELIQSGQAYVNVHTSDAPAGEINGHIH